MSLMTLPEELVPRAAEHVASAMMNDPLHVFFFPDPRSRFRKLTALYRYELANERERCYVTSTRLEGLAIWEAPGAHRRFLRLREVATGLGLAISCGPLALLKMLRYQLRATSIRDDVATGPHWYLQVIAVAPEHQGKGFASVLIRPFLEAASRSGQDVYLETHNEHNVTLYGRYGFEAVRRIALNGGSITHVGLLRKALDVPGSS